ncbi:mitochondrial carrier [Fragilariopsis cylindrus CCMP1102]|uniref:Mitochondrial carrier n=1 Tax=Fragilariopsis cylindrus CCMP1102 TaxID=635003 RepID=A0A1E7FGW2_9STRA|nr:mitochondrial carrier [Fragilariopsis cylindrus CCMP1102]|eukprot:OEU17374.1 mitochondrial carrier [Fragilariopsis cylindrus CCMP1102]
MNWKKDQKAIMQGMNHTSRSPPMPLLTISIGYCCFILFILGVTVLPRASSFSTTSSTTQPSRSKHNILPKTTESESHLVVDFDNVFNKNIEHDALLSNTESESHLVGIGNVLNNNNGDTDSDIDTYNVDLESRRILASILTVGFVFTLIGTHPDIASATADISSSSHPISSNIEIATTTGTGTVDWNSIFQKATKRAIGGGKAGASAAVVQVLSLMWLRTSMNRQYRYGGDLVSSLKELWKEGGIPRLYQGLQFAIIQGPLTRFGDTAANVGVLVLLDSFEETQSLPLYVKTGLGSVSAGLWRIVLMPIDASKTALQVEGKEGLNSLISIVKKEGPGPLYNGALAQAAATAAGHFPWFLTYNYVDGLLPTVLASDDLLLSLARSALLGICASSVSDISSNSLRVIKTTKQTARLGDADGNGVEGNDSTTKGDKTYQEIVQMIIEKDGLMGLFGRGLQTRLLTNCIQGAIFSVLFKYFQQQN